MIKHILVGALTISSVVSSVGQDLGNKVALTRGDWFNYDPVEDSIWGVSANRVYKELTRGMQPTEVIVAVIDGGVDVEHEDLKDKVWRNTDEVPNNNIDDDGNGYIDDVVGWSFIGGADGDVNYDTYEVVRVMNDLKLRVQQETSASKRKSLQTELDSVSAEYTRMYSEAQDQFAQFSQFRAIIDQAKMQLGIEDQMYTAELVQNTTASTQEQTIAKEMLLTFASQGMEEADFVEYLDYLEAKVKYQLNPEYDSRSIVGDNYNDPNDRFYGNANVTGPDATHGTHVAGIIGAMRNNNIGIDGIGIPVKIMAIRAVPNGDERDKDVANAIRYAVDNGAHIVNMSFGKGYSPQKGLVDEAIKYAQKNDVLLVHAAGNSGMDTDVSPNFPKDRFDKGFFNKNAKNWIEVGASGPYADVLVGDFSNYGKEGVDVFAPGVDILSTYPNNTYKENSGTSMAAPVVSGVAAVLKAYFPKLSAKEIKSIIEQSVIVPEFAVRVPQLEGNELSLSDISKNGGVVNLYYAFQLAMQKNS